MKCRKCGCENIKTAQYCKNCGTKLNGNEKPVADKKNRSFRNIGLLGLIVIMCVGCCILYSCSKSIWGAKSDGKIRKEIQEKFEMKYSNIFFSDISVDIDKRQTNQDDKTDYITLSIVAENEDIELSCNCETEYIKYNEGWNLEVCEFKDTSYTLLRTSVTEEDAEKAFLDNYTEEYDELELIDRETLLGEKKDIFYYQVIKEKGYREENKEIEFGYEYSLNGGWEFSNIEVTNVHNTWTIEGRWTYSDTKTNMWVDIKGIYDDEIELEYDLNYTCTQEIGGAYSQPGEFSRHIKSDGVERLKLKDDNGKLRIDLDDTTISPALHITEYGGITFDGWVWNEDDMFVFYYEDGDGYETRDSNDVWDEKILLNSILPVYINGSGKIYSNNQGDYKIALEHGEPLEDTAGETYVDTTYYVRDEEEYSNIASETYQLYGKYNKLTGKVLLTEQSSTKDKASVNIYGDGEKIYSCTPKNISSSGYVEFELDISKMKELTIECSGESHTDSGFLVGSYEVPILAYTDLRIMR